MVHTVSMRELGEGECLIELELNWMEVIFVGVCESFPPSSNELIRVQEKTLTT